MRKQVLEPAEGNTTSVSCKHQIRLNDDDIREVLMDSHPDLQEESLDSVMTRNAGAVMVLLLQSRSEANLADPTGYQTNLSVYWKLFVQKRILGFEQELFPLLNWRRIRV